MHSVSSDSPSLAACASLSQRALVCFRRRRCRDATSRGPRTSRSRPTASATHPAPLPLPNSSPTASSPTSPLTAVGFEISSGAPSVAIRARRWRARCALSRLSTQRRKRSIRAPAAMCGRSEPTRICGTSCSPQRPTTRPILPSRAKSLPPTPRRSAWSISSSCRGGCTASPALVSAPPALPSSVIHMPARSNTLRPSRSSTSATSPTASSRTAMSSRPSGRAPSTA